MAAVLLRKYRICLAEIGVRICDVDFEVVKSVRLMMDEEEATMSVFVGYWWGEMEDARGACVDR